MGADAHLDWHQAAASALAWWDEAGVDTLVDDAPRDWLAPVARAVAPSPAALPGVLPDTLEAYLTWRGGEDAPEAGWPGAAIPATGPAHSALMVLVDCPDRDDDGRLMGGAAGRLFDRMLAAIGLTRDEVHLAALCLKRPTAGRLPADAHERLAELARHHIALVAPKRLLVMGNAASRAILAADVAPARGRLHTLNHKTAKDGAGVEAVATYHPRFLLERAGAKAAAWADLLLVTRGWE